MDHGPSSGPLSHTLVAIADNADDYGFAFPSIETLATKSRCDVRTVMRRIQRLETAGWIRVRRRVLGGKGSVYFINLEKLGVTVNSKSRRSAVWGEINRLLNAAKSGDILSCEKTPKSGDKMSPESLFSGDNSQPSQVTKRADSGDKSRSPLINHQEPLFNRNASPQPPSQAKGARLPSLAASADDDAKGFDEAVAKVQRECGLSGARIGGVIGVAMRLEESKDDHPDTWNSICERMIRSYKRFLKEQEWMAYKVLAPRFFAELWDDDRKWPWDEKKLSERRRF